MPVGTCRNWPSSLYEHQLLNRHLWLKVLEGYLFSFLLRKSFRLMKKNALKRSRDHFAVLRQLPCLACFVCLHPIPHNYIYTRACSGLFHSIGMEYSNYTTLAVMSAMGSWHLAVRIAASLKIIVVVQASHCAFCTFIAKRWQAKILACLSRDD